MSRKEWEKEGFFYYDKIRPYFCKHCNQRFEDWINFYMHYNYVKGKIVNEIKTDMKNRGYSDKFIEAEFPKRLQENKDYQLLQESYNENKKKRPFVCNLCGKNFRNKVNLKAHYLKIHGIDVDKLREEREHKEQEMVSSNAEK